MLRARVREAIEGTRPGQWLVAVRRLRLWGGPGQAVLAVTPGAQWTWGGPMNGQHGRRELVRRIATGIRFRYVIETGTHRGATTGFLADVTGAPVHTVDTDPVSGGYAARVFAGRTDVTVSVDDCRRFLERVAGEQVRTDPVLFYLDAHWDAQDLPLWEEIRFVFANWDHPVVVVDDFAVPGDPGYGFDAYGVGRSLCLDDLLPHLPEAVEAWFPTLPSGSESGSRRGCVVLVRSTPPAGWDPDGMLSLARR